MRENTKYKIHFQNVFHMYYRVSQHSVVILRNGNSEKNYIVQTNKISILQLQIPKISDFEHYSSDSGTLPK